MTDLRIGWHKNFSILLVKGEIRDSPLGRGRVAEVLTEIRQGNPLGDMLDREILVVVEDTELGKLAQGWAKDCWYQTLVVDKKSDKELVQAAEMTVFINPAPWEHQDLPEQYCQITIDSNGEVSYD